MTNHHPETADWEAELRTALQHDAQRAPELPQQWTPRTNADDVVNDHLSSRHRNRYALAAAAGVVLIVGTVGLVAVSQRNPDPPPGPADTPSVPVATSDPTTPESQPDQTVPDTAPSEAGAPNTTIVVEPPGPNDLESVLARELEGRYAGIGRNADGLTVTLVADDTDLAAQLHERYGDEITLIVGALAFPPDRATNICAPQPIEPTTSSAGLQVTVNDPTLAASGPDNFSLEIAVANNGPTPLVLGSPLAQSEIIDQTGSVVSAGNVNMLLMRNEVIIEPGDTATITALAGTPTCDPSLGYKIPPGEYQLIATLPTEPDPTVLSPINVTITEPT